MPFLTIFIALALLWSCWMMSSGVRSRREALLRPSSLAGVERWPVCNCFPPSSLLTFLQAPACKLHVCQSLPQGQDHLLMRWDIHDYATITRPDLFRYYRNTFGCQPGKQHHCTSCSILNLIYTTRTNYNPHPPHLHYLHNFRIVDYAIRKGSDHLNSHFEIWLTAKHERRPVKCKATSICRRKPNMIPRSIEQFHPIAFPSSVKK